MKRREKPENLKRKAPSMGAFHFLIWRCIQFTHLRQNIFTHLFLMDFATFLYTYWQITALYDKIQANLKGSIFRVFSKELFWTTLLWVEVVRTAGSTSGRQPLRCLIDWVGNSNFISRLLNNRNAPVREFVKRSIRVVKYNCYYGLWSSRIVWESCSGYLAAWAKTSAFF